MAADVEEIVWHKTQQTQRLSDKALLFTVQVDGLTEISRWILGFGDQVIVEEPVELRIASRPLPGALRASTAADGYLVCTRSRDTRRIQRQSE